MIQRGELILYQTEDGKTQISLKALDGTVWLIQDEIGELFNKSRSTVAEHLQNIFIDGELDESSVRRNFRRTAADGKDYEILHYNLEAILAVGYRVRSPRGVQFRKWASTILKEYLIKGFAMDDARLKQAKQWDYFDEWLERIRDIRASEKRFYQKIKDLYTTAIDYNKKSDEAKEFFKKVQNKMLWAVTGKTAAELVAIRSNPDIPNMSLQSWTGSRVRKMDVDVAKNYLNKSEIEELNRIVTMYLDYAEDQAKKRNAVTMKSWSDKLDAFLTFNERELLTNAGQVQSQVAKKLAEDRYTIFDNKRKKEELLYADNEDIKELEEITERLINKAGRHS